MSCACEEGRCSTGNTTLSQEKEKPMEMYALYIRFVCSSLLFAIGFFVNNFYLQFILYFFSWALAGYQVLLSAGKNILRGKIFDENFLMSIATIGAFIIGQWTEAAAVMLFYTIGEIIQESAVKRSRKSITDLIDVRAEFARLDTDGSIVSPSEVQIGMHIRVLPHEKIPLDGLVVSGNSTVDTSSLTGESIPQDIEPNSTVLGGTINGSGIVIVKVSSLFSDSTAVKMLRLIEESQERKSRAEKFITSFARIYTPIVTIGAFLLAVLFPVLISLFSTQPLDWPLFELWIYRALVFLVISCPCAFVISVPLGFFGGIAGASRHGILLKGADFIDALSKTAAVVFDKTGTLTQGVFQVTETHHSIKGSQVQNFETSLAAELYSSHPVAQAIRSYISAELPDLIIDQNDIDQYLEYPGKGVSLTYKGTAVISGNFEFMKNNDVTVPAFTGNDGTIVYMASNGLYVAAFMLNDVIKEDSQKAVAHLASLGVSDIVMVSGDRAQSVIKIAESAGISEYYAGVLPHEKVTIYEKIRERIVAKNKRYTTLFVGDGINDAAVLARSDVGIAMGGIGSDAAVEAADVVLMNDNPLQIAHAIEIARYTRKIVAQNIIISFVIKIGFLVLGAMGLATLWEAVFADVGVALIATLNALRARNIRFARL